MTSEIEKYQVAKQAHLAADLECVRVTGIIHHASTVLKNWKLAMVSNSSAGFPMEIALNQRSPSINAGEWITAHDIGTALAAYHATKSAEKQAYSAIPDDQRAVVVPPSA